MTFGDPLLDSGVVLFRRAGPGATPHGELRPFHQMSTCLTQLSLGLFRTIKWLQFALKIEGNETRVVHLVEGLSDAHQGILYEKAFKIKLSGNEV